MKKKERTKHVIARARSARSNLRTGIASPALGPSRNDSYVSLIEHALEHCLPKESTAPSQIHEAMRYAVLEGGKRFRPLLVLSACEAVGGNPKQALLPACAVELIHCYSLVHDDLPALDNDETRRGKPTCHRKFGEAMAILAGDALLTQAFRILSEVTPARKAAQLIRELGEAAGTRGMIGGQVVDILHLQNGSRSKPDLSTLDYLSQQKTGRLIEAGACLGAMVGTDSAQKIEKIRRFANSLGLAFQVVDDIMDRDGYLRWMSPDQARQKAVDLIEKAKQEIETFGKKAKGLLALADFLLDSLMRREHVLSDIQN